MRPLSKTLTDLIGIAEEVLMRPSGMDIVRLRNRLQPLTEEIERAVRLPADGRRTTSAAAVMEIALREVLFSRVGQDDLSQEWRMIAGAGLPLLRSEAFIAFSNERTQGTS